LERSAPTKISVRALVVLGVVAVVVYAIDQVAKFLVVTHLTERVPVPILGDLLTFQFVRNPGAAFSIGSGSTWIFSIIATGVLIFVIWYARRIRSIGWAMLFGLLLGGLLGNLSDRLTRPPGFGVGAVVDFIQIPLLPAIFNLADVAIVSSMALFLILTLRGVGLNGPAAGESVADEPTSEPAADDAGADNRPTTER
jgi:signal peptidase II